MAGLKCWATAQLLLLLLLLFFHLCYVVNAILRNYPSMNLSTSWETIPSNEMGNWDFNDGSNLRPILFVYDGSIPNPPIGFGFFANTSSTTPNSFYLVAFLVTGMFNSHLEFKFDQNYPPVVIWAANRDKPVREKAKLDFTAEGDLQLKDADGSIVWSTNTSGHSVTKLNITVGGNLMLLDDKNIVKWQSFDYPTDTWLPNQEILIGKRLTARSSSFNLSTGFYYLSVTHAGADAYIDSNPPKKYRDFIHQDSMSVVDGYRYFNATIEVAQGGSVRFNLYDVAQSDFVYIILEPSGHLNVYRLEKTESIYGPPFDYFDVKLSGNLLHDTDVGDCGYPTVCGNYGVCSNGQQCSCPAGSDGNNASYFVPSHDDLQQTFQCTQVTPLSCNNTQLQTFLELKNVTYFDFVPSHSYMDAESCKKACLDTCTCKAAIFQYEQNVTSGSCSLQSHLFSLMTADEKLGYYFDGGYGEFYTYAFIKVQKSLDRIKLPSIQRSQGKRKLSSLIPILVPSLSVGLVIVSIIFIVGARCYYKILLRKSSYIEEDDRVIGALTKFSFKELKCATHDFQTRLGRGGFGSVFEGIMGDGSKVAVKRLESKGQGRREFLAEVNTIGNIHHFNLVRLIGYCIHKSDRLLVYEHLCNGSLDKWIFNFRRDDRATTLSWEIRQNIINGIAKGLEYLHVHCNPNIIHFDIKPQNILLDADFNAKISDFGLAKLIDRDQSQVLTAFKGTFGYVAPELFKGTNISVKADVFSFGIVMLEIVCGRKNLDSSQYEPLIDIVKEKAEMDQLNDLVDELYEDMQSHKEDVTKMIKIAMWCLQVHERRPSMSMVVKVLEGLVDMESAANYCFSTMAHRETHLQANLGVSTNSTPPVASILSGPR